MYRIVLADKQVQKQINALPSTAYERVKKAILNLEKDPRPQGIRKLEGQLKGVLRIRTGSYRVLYDIDDKKKAVVIIDVKHRREVYR